MSLSNLLGRIILHSREGRVWGPDPAADQPEVRPLRRWPSLAEVWWERPTGIPEAWNHQERRFACSMIHHLLRCRREAVAEGIPLRVRLESDARRNRAWLDDVTAHLRKSNRESEILVREVAWALSHPGRSAGPLVVPVKAAFAEEIDLPGPWWWPGTGKIPAELVERADQLGIPLLAARQCKTGCSGQTLFSEANAVSLGRDGEMGDGCLELTALAALIQAHLSAPHAPGWIPVYPPGDECELMPDLFIDDMPEHHRHQRVGMLWGSGVGSEIVLPPEILGKTAGQDRYRGTGKTRNTQRKGNAMNDQNNGTSVIKWKESGVVDEQITKPICTIFCGLMPESGPRKLAGLKKLEESPVDSVEEFCAKTGMRLKGEVKDIEGESVSVDAPVENAETFTADGMTRAVPQLFQRYVQVRTFEDMQPALEEDPDPLSDEDVAWLEAYARDLDNANSEVL